MNLCLRLLGLLALALVIVPAWLAFNAGGGLSQTMKALMLVGTLLWFAVAIPLNLMGRASPPANLEPQEPR